eukprot:PITA_24905
MNNLENIPVIQEFADVFPESILGLPPKRDIDFTIELIPRVAPTSKAPYRMSIPELTELKMQLQELLDKKYICLSVSPWLRKDVIDYLSKCLESQLVKEEHQHPPGLFQTFPIAEWKWETISLDFLTNVPYTKNQHDSIMVVVDKLRKTVHFIPVKSTFKTVEIADIFMKEFFCLHRILKVVISDKDVKFTSTFWKNLFSGLGTQIQFSIAYHYETDGQTERVNQVLEDMLHMFLMKQPHKWDDYLHLVEFAYNNGHHEFLGMSPFEELYGRRCRVEPEGEFLAEPLRILDQRETTLRKRTITQVKV